MRALVTGGAGFIGSHVVDRLLERGDEVCVLDLMSTGRRRNVSHHLGDPRFRCVAGTILDARAIERLVAACDVVYHLAAVVGVRYIVTDPLSAVMTNVTGTENVLRAALRHGKKVVLASSSEVYGKSTKVPLSEDDDRILGPTTVARWSYSSSKAIDEHLAYAYAAQGLPVVILRFFNAYGPRVHENGYGTVVARFVHQAFNGRPLTVHGDGRQTRCFCYVSDTVRGILLAGASSGAEGHVFNIGNDAEISIFDLARTIRLLVGSASQIRRVPYEDDYGQRFEDTLRRVPDLGKARRILGYQPEISLDRGLGLTIDWWRRNHVVDHAAAALLPAAGGA